MRKEGEILSTDCSTWQQLVSVGQAICTCKRMFVPLYVWRKW